jgi:hypothetical protein
MAVHVGFAVDTGAGFSHKLRAQKEVMSVDHLWISF